MSDSPKAPGQVPVVRAGDAVADPPGRGLVLVPMPRGSWLLGLGLALAALAPLAGFLGGSIIGTKGAGTVNPMYLSLFGGFVLGGVGVLLAGLGGLRLYRTLHPAATAPSPPA